MTATGVLDVLEELITKVVAPAADELDAGALPRPAGLEVGAAAPMAPTDALQDFIGRAVCGLPRFG